MGTDHDERQPGRPTSQVWYGLALAAALLGAVLWQKAESDYRDAVVTARWEAAFSGTDRSEPQKDRGPAYVAFGAASVLLLAGVTAARGSDRTERAGPTD